MNVELPRRRGGPSGAPGRRSAFGDKLGAVAHHPYRAQLPGDPAPRRARLERAWSHAAAVPLIVGAAPAFLVALCVTVRAYDGPGLMPATILYPAIGYAVLVLCACAIDGPRR